HGRPAFSINQPWCGRKWVKLFRNSSCSRVMSRCQPARVPDAVISEIRSRERNGFVELKPRGLRPGTRVRVTSGPLSERIGMLAVLKPHERMVVLLNLLGGDQRVDLAMNAIEAIG